MSEKLEPGAIYWRAIEPIWGAISIYDGPREFLRQFKQVKRPVGYMFAVHWCQSEIRNGGFHQFFSNPTGVLAPEALHGFRTIGMDDCADLLQEAMKYFGAEYSRGQNSRISRLARRKGSTRAEWDPFYGLDEKFYALLDRNTSRLERAMDAFVEKEGLLDVNPWNEG